MCPYEAVTDTSKEHKEHAPKAINFAVVTISSSMYGNPEKEDISGKEIGKLLDQNKYRVVHHRVIPDDKDQIQRTIFELTQNEEVQAIITSGGTGLAPTDVTIETLRPLFEKELIGFNSLFMKLSYEEIGSACMLSRATAGVINGRIIFCLPGSPKACVLALNRLIIPEVGHIIKHLSE